MRKFIPALSLAITLGLTSIGGTAPRATKAAPSYLTSAEQVCLSMGGIAHSSATMRDNGLSYLEALQHLRKAMAGDTTPGVWIDWFRANVITSLRFAYERPSYSPAQVRQITELVCVQQFEASLPPAQPTTAKERY